MNDFISKFNNVPLGQRILFLSLIIIGMTIGFILLMYQPLTDDIAKKEVQLQKLQREQEKLKQLQANKAEVMAKLERLDRKLLIAKEKLPDSAEVPSLLQRIHNQAKTAGLEIKSFKRVPNQNKNYYTEIPVSMRLVGTYDELANFFYYIGRMTRIVNTSELGLKRLGRDPLDMNGNLEVTALATTFMYKRQAAQPVAPKGRRGGPKKGAKKKGAPKKGKN